jgi:glycosyltransferase involved in cell wall biosynthesis
MPSDLPLVSCIMPTFNRRPFVPQAIQYFLRQDYPEKELIVVDDGTDPVVDLIGDADGIRYVRLTDRKTASQLSSIFVTNATH